MDLTSFGPFDRECAHRGVSRGDGKRGWLKGSQLHTLYVGGLPRSASSEELRSLFEQFDGLTEARVVKAATSDNCRGFGYVTFASDIVARRAREALDGHVMGGSPLRVDLAR